MYIYIYIYVNVYDGASILFMYNEGAIDCMPLGTRRVDPRDLKIYGRIGHRNIEHAVIHAGTYGHACRDIRTYDHAYIRTCSRDIGTLLQEVR